MPANSNMLFNRRNEAINFLNDHGSMIIVAKIKAVKGEGLKILTRKQMHERLSIAFAQVRARNTSKNLLNEIRKIIYSLYREK